MSQKIRKELILEGLDWVNCTSRIEAKVSKLEGVKLATLNFVTKTFSIEIDDENKMNSIIIAIRDIVNKYEPHVIVKEKIIDKVGKKVLVLRDLHVPAALRK